VLYLLFRRALAVAALRRGSAEFKELEIVVLRHELGVLQRPVARPRPAERDRVFLAAASRLLSGASRSFFFVRPETHPTQRSQESPISRTKLRTSRLALEQLQLVTQDENLDFLRPLRTHPQQKQLQQPPQRPIEKTTQPVGASMREGRLSNR